MPLYSQSAGKHPIYPADSWIPGGEDTQSRVRRHAAALASVTARGLPGTAAQREMAPPGHEPERRAPEGTDYPHARNSAVLLALCPGSTRDEWYVAVIERIDDGGVHAGQAAFPGGAHEPPERFPEETALREAHEEIGLDPRLVTVVDSLTPLYIPVSNFLVVPVVACVAAFPPRRHAAAASVSARSSASAVDMPPHMSLAVPSNGEVERVVFVALEHLARYRTTGLFRARRGTLRAPCFQLAAETVAGCASDFSVWGATAMILNELLRVHEAALGEETTGGPHGASPG